MNMKALIIGGGIGGLSLANALQQRNIAYQLFEAAPAFGEVGAGILLGANAMQIYQDLGLAESIYQKGQVLHAAHITDETGRMISSMPLQQMEKTYGVKTVIIHRAALIEVLKASLDTAHLELGKRAEKVFDLDKKPIIQFSDGSLSSGDCIIGADGIHSQLRQQIFPSRQKRYLGQTCWRGLVDFQLPETYRKVLTERWGKTGRFAFVAVNDHQVYWYAVMTAPKGQKDVQESIIQDLKNSFAHFEGPIAEILDNTEVKNILRNDIYDLKPQKGWSHQKVSFLGDAIHATSPNLGQGGAQAIEDAHALAYCLDQYQEIAQAFKQYEKYRFPKATFVVKQSKLFGELAHKKQAWVQVVRNFLLRSIPPQLFLKQMEKIYAIKKEIMHLS